MNTITIYTTTEDLLNKMMTIQKISESRNTEEVVQLKNFFKKFNVYITNKNSNRVAFNVSFSTLSLIAVFCDGNLLED